MAKKGSLFDQKYPRKTPPKETLEASPSSIQENNSFNPFPWNFTPKWPQTRAGRIHELQRVAPFYESTYQKENIAAAIHWHSRFAPDEICPEGLVFFQKGRMIEESEVRLEDGIPWLEGCEDEMVGDR